MAGPGVAAPLLAAAARAAGPMTRSIGRSMVARGGKGSAVAKLGRRLIRTSDKDVLFRLTQIRSNVAKTQTYAQVGNSYLKRLTTLMEKSSPAFAQQTTIMRKTFGLFMRPIGDVLAKHIRPWAIIGLRVAWKWYQLIGGLTGLFGKAGSPEAIKDQIEQLESQLVTAEESGDTVRVDEINKELERLRAALQEAGTKYTPREAVENFWDMAVDPFDLAGHLIKLFKILTPDDETKQSIWDKIRSAYPGKEDSEHGDENPINKTLDGIAEDMETDSTGFFGKLGDAFGGILTSVEAGSGPVSNAWSIFKNAAQSIWDNSILPGWKDSVTWGGKLFGKLKTAAGEVVTKIKDWRPSWWPGREDRARGGFIDKTGVYKLHAGETVLRAGQTSNIANTHNNNPFNITNNITIQAAISSDFDIRTIAQRLAEYQETQLRRRGSYL